MTDRVATGPMFTLGPAAEVPGTLRSFAAQHLAQQRSFAAHRPGRYPRHVIDMPQRLRRIEAPEDGREAAGSYLC